MAIQSGPNAFWAGQFCPRVMWLPKLLLPPLKIRIFGPKMAKFGPKYACLVILGRILAYMIIWCHARPIKRCERGTRQLLLFQKVKSYGGPFFKVVLEC